MVWALAVMGMQVAWATDDVGVTAFPKFASAPFPHESRKDGYSRGDKHFPASKYQDSTVGVFVPKGFVAGPTVDFVVHFHGHNNHVAQVFSQFDLRREMHDSGLNAVLLVPQGPFDAADSGDGKLERDAGALDRMLAEAISFLVAQGRVPAGAVVGKVALTAHSGGYLVTHSILGRGDLKDHITDVLLFDATYGGLDHFADWAAVPGHRLVSVCTDHLGHENAQLVALLQKKGVTVPVKLEEDVTVADLTKRGPLVVLTTTLEHNDTVSKRHFFSQWLAVSDLSTRRR
jgi:hypothetical protein